MGDPFSPCRVPLTTDANGNLVAKGVHTFTYAGEQPRPPEAISLREMRNSPIAESTLRRSSLAALGVAAFAISLFGVGTGDPVELAVGVVGAALFPAAAAAVAVNGGLRPWDTASWAIPAWFLIALGNALPLRPVSSIPFVVGVALAAAMVFSPQARAYWYRVVLRSTVRRSKHR